MDAFEVNKTAGAVLSALLVIFASKTMLDIAYKEHKPEKPGWALPITEVAPPPPRSRRRRSRPPRCVALLPKASPDNGQDTFKKCLPCHTAAEGRPERHRPQSLGRRRPQARRARRASPTRRP